ncbi:hypothetical protein [Mycolicibacterium goodii]|uniref:Keratin associated protein n=1 Tax=Mycolicibacterium goodii TaxID=134601 RepID=A0A0K0WZP8_MYCGD|nr:keratin associated protein [Mycolicibacterium goodii]
MSIRIKALTLLAGGAGSLAVALAPAAQAAPTGPTCTAQGNSTLCQSEGNAQVTANPPAVDYQAQYPFFGGYALLFHHGGDHR